MYILSGAIFLIIGLDVIYKGFTTNKTDSREEKREKWMYKQIKKLDNMDDQCKLHEIFEGIK